MRNITKQTKTLTAVDKFNMKCATSLKDILGDTIKVKAACIGMDTKADGELVEAGALVTEDNQSYTTISPTVIDQIDSLIEIIDEDGATEVVVESRKSNSDRDYLVLTIVG